MAKRVVWSAAAAFMAAIALSIAMPMAGAVSVSATTTSFTINSGQSQILVPTVSGCSAQCIYSWTLTQAPDGAASSGVLSSSLTYTASATFAGAYVYTFDAYDPSSKSTASISFTVTVLTPASAIVVKASASPATITSGASTTLSSTVSGGTGQGYTYEWYTASAAGTCSSSDYQISTLSSFTDQPMANTYYCLIVTDSNGDTGASSTVLVTVNPAPTSTTTTSATTTTALYLLPYLHPEQIACNSYLGKIIGISSCSCGLLPQLTAAQISTSEPWYCPINEQIYNQWKPWLPLIIVATLIAFLIAAVIFMVGVALQSAKVRNFGQSEFYEAIATAMMAVAFVYVSSVMFGVIPGTFTGAINPYATAFNLIASTINSAQTMYASIYNMYMAVSYSSSLTITVTGTGGGLVTSLFSVLGILPNAFASAYSFLATVLVINPANALAGFLVDGMAILYGEYYLLMFFAVASVPVFLLPGVILRAFLPTRALGGTMIAMAVGFYFVMPALFAAAFYFTAPSVLRSMAVANANFAYLQNSPGSVTNLSPTSPMVTDLQYGQSSLNGFWFLILFYPALAIAITYSVVQQLAQLIGGSYRAGTRLRTWI